LSDLLIERLPVLSLLCFGAARIPLGVTNIVFVSTLQELLPVEMVGMVFSATAGAVCMAGPLDDLLGGFLGNVRQFHRVFFRNKGHVARFRPMVHRSAVEKYPESREMDPVKYGLSRHTALNRQYGKIRK